MAEESLRTMTNPLTGKQMLDVLSKLSPEQLKQKVEIYDRYTGNVHNLMKVIHTGDGDESLNIPKRDDGSIMFLF